MISLFSFLILIVRVFSLSLSVGQVSRRTSIPTSPSPEGSECHPFNSLDFSMGWGGLFSSKQVGVLLPGQRVLGESDRS